MDNGTKNTSNKAFENSDSTNNKKRNKPNIFSTVFFWWVCPVLVTGNKRDVEEDDLIVPPKKYDADRQGVHLEKYWLAEYENAINENREPKLWKALFRGYWLSYMPGAIYIVIQAALRTYQPILFAQLLSYWSVESSLTRTEAGYYALAMLGMNFLNMMCQHHSSLFVARFGMRVKVACSSLLYRKLLRMSQVALGDVAGGKLVNLLSNDVARFDYAFMFMHYLWVIPIQAAVVLYLIYQTAGWAPYVGLFSVVIILMPLQAGLTKLTAIVRRETAQRTDKRIKLMSEIINGIQVIKMYAWEKPFQVVVKAARRYELQALRKSSFIRSVFLGFMLFTERTILLITCLTLILSGTNVTATLIYPVQQYFSVIQMNLTLILPFAIANISEMLVSLDRIQSFLVMEEREDCATLPVVKGGAENGGPTKFRKSSAPREPSSIVPKKFAKTEDTAISAELVSRRTSEADVDYPVELLKVSASWTGSKNPTEQFLKNLSLRLRKGKLCAIIGPVGSGKDGIQPYFRYMRHRCICPQYKLISKNYLS